MGHVLQVSFKYDKFKRLIKESLLVTKGKALFSKQVKSLKSEFLLFNSTYNSVSLYLR